MRFTDVLASEIVKARTHRAVRVTVIVAVGFSLIYCLLDASPDLGLASPATAGVYAMANLSFFAAIVGVLIASSEYVGGQLTTSVLAVPQRAKTLAAKLMVSATATTALGLALAAAIATIEQAPLGVRSAYATGTGTVLISNLGLAVVSWTGVGLLSTSIAFVIRSQTGALVTMIVLSFGGTPLMMALPVLQYLPTNAGVLMFIDRANQTSDWLNPPTITPLASGVVLALWCLAAMAAAMWAFRRRDIGPRQAEVG